MSEPAIQAHLSTLGFGHSIVTYVPRIATPGTSTSTATVCPCGYDSLAVRQPDSPTKFGPRAPTGAAAEAARADLVRTRVRPATQVLTAARPLSTVMTVAQADCCAFAMLVDVEWRLQAPNGTHILPALVGAGVARVRDGSRLVLGPGALRGHRHPYTVGVVVRHSGTGGRAGGRTGDGHRRGPPAAGHVDGGAAQWYADVAEGLWEAGGGVGGGAVLKKKKAEVE